MPTTYSLPLDRPHRQGQVSALGPAPGTLEQHHQRDLSLAGPSAQVTRRGETGPAGRAHQNGIDPRKQVAGCLRPPGTGMRDEDDPAPSRAPRAGGRDHAGVEAEPTAAHQLPEHEAAASNASASVVAPWPGAPLTVTVVPRRREPPGKRGVRGRGTGRVRPATGVVGRTRAASPSGSCRDGREGTAPGWEGAAAGIEGGVAEAVEGASAGGGGGGGGGGGSGARVGSEHMFVP